MKIEKMSGKRKGLVSWLLLSIFFLAAIQILGLFLISDPVEGPDPKEYLTLSGNVFHGKGYSLSGLIQREDPVRTRQPVYPLFLILFYWLPGGKLLFVQLAQFVLHGLTFFLVFLIARDTFGDELWAGTIVALAIYFPLWLTSAFVSTECVFSFFIALSMFVFWKALKSGRGLWPLILSGTCLGLMFLTRPAGLALPFLSFFTLWYHFGFRKAFLRWGVIVTAFLVVLFPWFLRNVISLNEYTAFSAEGGHGVWEASLENERRGVDGEMVMSYSPPPEIQAVARARGYCDHSPEVKKLYIQEAIENVKKAPFSYLARGIARVAWVWSYFPGSRIFYKNSLVFGLFSLVQIFLLLFAAIGFYFVLGPKERTYYLLPVLALTFPLLFHAARSRYIIASMPFVIVVAGQGLYYLRKKLF